MFCSKCGTKNNEGSSFCSNCGEHLVDSRHTRVCPYCKKEIDEKATICPYCRKSKNARVFEIIGGIILLIIGLFLMIDAQNRIGENNQGSDSSSIKIDILK